MERGRHDGAPRYRNPNNIFLFRHRLRRSEELGITRQTCLPENELIGEDLDSVASNVALTLGQEVSGKFALDFSRLVKTSLQTINLDREARNRSILLARITVVRCSGNRVPKSAGSRESRCSRS